MAITKIWSVKSRLDTSLNYISNPDKTTMKPNTNAVEGVIQYIKNSGKTEQCKYVTAYGCSVDSPFMDMMQTKQFFEDKPRKNGVSAYHIVQSFKDFETTPEIAHQCGKELVERLFESKYETVIATHLDHEHLHNHIIINSTSYVDGSKYRNNFKDYFVDIRGISDAICREHCLSVIENPKRRGMHYAEWKAIQEGRPTIRGQVRDEIDSIIVASYTMKEFWKIFQERGNRIHRQGDNIKHVSFIPACGKKPMRFTNLGDGYTIEDIRNRITAQRNGIRTSVPARSQPNKKYKYNGSFQQLKPKKLKGFVALYFHYMYFFKLIRKKQTPQRVSFFMRDELIKLERYQKQFRFLYSNNIETGTDLLKYQKAKEERINDLVEERTRLYASKTADNEHETTLAVSGINTELRGLRADIRMCKSIAKDACRISERKKHIQSLIRQAKKEMKANEHKKWSVLDI